VARSRYAAAGVLGIATRWTCSDPGVQRSTITGTDKMNAQPTQQAVSPADFAKSKLARLTRTRSLPATT